MSRALVILFSLCCLACWAQNPLTNGGFELLDTQGRPLDWQPLGNTITVTTDAHSGRYALRFERGSGANVPPEVGLNRSWMPDSGQQGKMLAERKGGIVFWYKLLSASPGASVSIQVIPMSARPFEDTGSSRAIYQIPLRHAGDGRWHQGKLVYDFTSNPKVKWVHVGVRLIGGPAVLIVDDMEYVERVGAVLQFEKMHFYPDKSAPDRAGTFTASVTNTGDTPSEPVRVQVRAPEEWRMEPLRVPQARAVAPGDGMTFRWQMRGTLKPATLRLTATDGKDTVQEEFALSPRVELESALMKPAMVAPGQVAEMVATVHNRGSAIAEGIVLSAQVVTGRTLTLLSPAIQRIASLAPGERAQVRWKVRADTSSGEWQVQCRLLTSGNARQTSSALLLVTDALRRPAQQVEGALWIRRGSDRIIGELRVGNRLMARLPHLGSVVVRLPDGSVQRLFPRYGAPFRRSPLLFTGRARDRGGARWTFTLLVQRLDARTLKLEYACASDQPRDVLAFEGPILLVGDGNTADAKSEAIFPGLEWLTTKEVSSSDLDIAADHPDRIRFVPHPHKVTIPAMGVKTPAGVVGLLWDVHDRWSKGLTLPQPIFAVPDRLKGTATHRLGLMAPNVPAGLGENRLIAQRPLRVAPGNFLRLSALIYIDPQAKDALSVLDRWFAHFVPDPPLPTPQGSDLRQIEWSMKAYTDSLWVSPEQGWLPFQGGPAIWSRPAFRADYVYDLHKALLLVPGSDEAQAWRKLIDTVLPNVRIPQADDLQFEYGDPANSLSSLRSRALELMQSQNADGSWGFDADRRDQGVFKGYDYHQLGPPGAVELGTCARNAYEILRYARLSGSEEAYRVGAKTLEFMCRFTVPRAAQVWEVPVHTPDILAAADAVDAYLEGYWFSGDERWLAEARRWARAGLPFVYVWNADGKPWMCYGSIPVFGASLYLGSWFGNIVQWNGLRYAYALLKLCETDKTAPPLWRQVALGITRCAMYQQSTAGKNLALWPDSYHTITDVRAAWDFDPRQILKNVYHFLGHEEEPRTIRLPSGIRISSRAVKMQASETGGSLRIVLRHPKGEAGSVLVSGITRPSSVTLDGQSLAEAEHGGRDSKWWYLPQHRALIVRVNTDAEVTLEIRDARRAEVPALPSLVTALRFEFNEDTEGWEPANDLLLPDVRNGVLKLRSAGADPYMIRSLCRFEGDVIRQIRLRLRGTGGRGAQFYWTTASSPGFDEAKVVRFELPLDGEWHEVVIPVGEHPLWRGQTITAIRLDPGSAPNTVVEIDWIRGE